jgi:hypothetical protein
VPEVRVSHVVVQEPVHSVGVEKVTLAVLGVRGERTGHVDARIDEKLKGDRRPIAVAGVAGHHGGKVSSCAVTGHCKSGGVAAVFGGVSRDPTCGGVAIRDGRRKAMFRCQSVVHAHHQCRHPRCQSVADRVMAGDVADHKAAAMEVDDDGKGPVVLRVIDAHGDVPGKAGHNAIFGWHPLFRWPHHKGDQRGEAVSRLLSRLLRHRRRV